MFYFGVMLYALLFIILFAFWRQVRGLSLDEIFARRAREHRQVHQVMARHSLGGTWKEHCHRMQEEFD